MRRSLFLLALALALPAAFAGRVEASPAHASPLNSGDRVAGTIDSASDRDLFRLEIPEGATLQAVVKASGKTALLPDLGLLDPAGVPVDIKRYVVGQTTGTVSIPLYGVHATGSWTLVVSGFGGTTGDYRLSARVAVVPKVKATLTLPAGATVQQHFTGTSGARVDYSIVEREGPGLAAADICCPRDNPIAGTAADRSKDRLSARRIVLAQGGGLYGLTMTNSGVGPTTVDVTLSVRLPRVKARRLRLDAEPRPSSLSPTVGRDGTPFVLEGTGFQPGARVVFCDTDEAVSVQFVSDTEIRGVAPECDAARQGESALVSVVNPDGQYGSTTVKFAFVGIPGPSDFLPRLSRLEGGVTVLVTGARFREGYTVEVNGVASPSVTLIGPTQLSFTTPPNPAGNYGVVLRDEFGRAAPPIPGLWYSDTPDVVSVDPRVTSSLGGATMNLVGTGLVDGVRVFVGGNEGVITAHEPPETLSFRCPAATAGPVELEVRDPLGRSFRGNLVTMTRAMHDSSATALPPGPAGADFRGDIANLGDATGDGRADILVTSRTRWQNPLNGQYMPASFLLANNGDGTFTDLTSSALPGFSLPDDDGQGDAALLGDLDGDGLADAALVRAAALPAAPPYTTFEGFKAYYDLGSAETVDVRTVVATRLLKNDGSGRLSDRTDELAPPTGSTPAGGAGERWQGRAAALGDLDGDGDADLVLASDGAVEVGTVTGVRWTYWYRYAYGYKYTYKDKAYLSQETAPVAALRVLENDGTGAFTHDADDGPAPVLSGSGAILDDFRGAALAAGDLNGDGLDDVVLVGAGRTRADDGAGGVKDAPALRILFNDGTGALRFFPGSTPAAPGASLPESEEWWQGETVALGDLDGDGDLDIAVGRGGVRAWVHPATQKTLLLPALRIFRNQGDTTFVEDTAAFLPEDLTTKPTDRCLLGVESMQAADLDGDGDVDLVVTGTTVLPRESAIPGASRMATRVFLNGGESGFEDATAEWLGTKDPLPAGGLALGDLDGDGIPDLVLAYGEDPGEGKRALRVFFSK